MRERLAHKIELNKEQRSKLLEVLRTFIRDECGVDVDETAYILPDVEFHPISVQAMSMTGSNPFTAPPEVLKEALAAASYTFTWYQVIGELKDDNRLESVARGLQAVSTSSSPWGHFEDSEDEDDDNGQIH